ncbi:MAG: Ald Xan dh protein [Chloroflexi bacterium]|nr:Ald Xan dh protein [Chloroflexota bacterium]
MTQMQTRSPRSAREPQPFERWQDEPRVDTRLKVIGQAKYAEDLPDPPNLIYAAAVRTSHSHARIVSVDVAAAEAVPGVLAVLHPGNVGEFGVHYTAKSTSDEPLFITTDRSRYDGDLVGMVAAVDLRTARKAAQLVDVVYDPLPVLFSVEEALAPGAALIHDDLGTNLTLEDSVEWGDVDSGLAAADRVFDETFVSPMVYAHPMEPATTVLVDATKGIFEYWMPIGNPHGLVQETAHLFGVDRKQVRVHVPYVGGTFGSKHFSPHLTAAAALSRKLGRPVKYVATDEEGFRLTSRHAMVYRARVGMRSDGTIIALDVLLDVDTGAYKTGGAFAATRNGVASSWGAYRVPNFRVRARTAYTNKVPGSFFRNTGKTQTTFGIEAAIDSVAAQMGIEPMEFRRLNALRRGEHHAEAWRVGTKHGQADIAVPLDTDLEEMMRQAVEGIGWDGRPTSPEERNANGRVARGRGLALMLRTGPGTGAANARATLDPDGCVTITHNTAENGAGSHTMLRIITARSLGIPTSQVRVTEPDTDNGLFFTGVSSMRTTVQMGGAVQTACLNLRELIVESASEVWGGKPGEWQIADGRLVAGVEDHGLADLVAALEGGPRLEADGSWTSPETDEPSFGAPDHWSPGAAAVEVEVDRETGEVRLLRYSAVADAGHALHYRSAQGQIEGGAIMGIGISLFEEMHYDEGQILNGDAFQYRLPLMMDIPKEFRATLIENGDGPGPFGAKAVAQVSIPCAAPAICNAIYDAVGVRVRATPFTAERVLAALEALPPAG